MRINGKFSGNGGHVIALYANEHFIIALLKEGSRNRDRRFKKNNNIGNVFVSTPIPSGIFIETQTRNKKKIIKWRKDYVRYYAFFAPKFKVFKKL